MLSIAVPMIKRIRTPKSICTKAAVGVPGVTHMLKHWKADPTHVPMQVILYPRLQDEICASQIILIIIHAKEGVSHSPAFSAAFPKI